jgi:hypothetical protein
LSKEPSGLKEETCIQVQAICEILGEVLAVLLNGLDEVANLGDELGLVRKILRSAVDHVALEGAANTLLSLGVKILLEGAELTLLGAFVPLNQFIQKGCRGGKRVQSQK